MLVFPNYTTFWKLRSSKTMSSRKNTFSLIRSLSFSFVGCRERSLVLNCERYWDRHGLPWDFWLAVSVCPSPRPRSVSGSVNCKYHENIEQCQPINRIWKSTCLSKPKLKCTENYQNTRITLAVLHFKNGRNYTKNYGSRIYKKRSLDKMLEF